MTWAAGAFVRVVWICAGLDGGERNQRPNTVRRGNVPIPYLQGESYDRVSTEWLLTESDCTLAWHTDKTLAASKVIHSYIIKTDILFLLLFFDYSGLIGV